MLPFLPQAPAIARPEALLSETRRVVTAGDRSGVLAMFAKPENGRYLMEMIDQRSGYHGGLKTFSVDVLPTPPGWEKTGEFWLLFHKRQPVEMDHDPIYPVISTPDGLRLGPEILETEGGDNRLKNARNEVHLIPADQFVDIVTDLDFEGKGPSRADVWRLQDTLSLSKATIDGKPRTIVNASGGIVNPKPGDLVRVGSLLIPWTHTRSKSAHLAYSGKLLDGKNSGGEEDLMDSRSGYLTAWWVPSTARLPFLSQTTVTGPKDWTIRSEGITVPPSAKAVFPPGPTEQRLAFKCDVPISFPKVIGGKYEVAASATDNGRTFVSYGFPPLDKARATRAVTSAVAAVKFFENLLGPFPFPGYEVYDADRFYGIESYSHTILVPGITDWATSHEIGHTYFGGLVPCAYVKDTWNESLTQYVDSILFKNNSDQTLQHAFDVMNSPPLSELPIAWSYSNASYMRGAYTMTMLAHEIGQDKVNAGLRAIVSDRRGKDTAWPDLRAYFEKSSGQDLGWFWDQWVTHAVWPKLELLTAVTPEFGEHKTKVGVKQSNTANPFRLRFVIKLSNADQTKSFELTSDQTTTTYDLTTPFAPTKASLETLGYTFGSVGAKSTNVFVQNGE